MNIRLGETSASAYGIAGPVAVGGGGAPENLHGGRHLAMGAMDPAAQRPLSRIANGEKKRAEASPWQLRLKV